MLREYLTADNIAFDLGGSAAEAIHTLITLKAVGPEQELLRNVFHPEKTAQYTYQGEDVLIPHARVSGLKRVVAALGISPQGILYGDQLIHVVLLLAVPAEMTALHLQ